MTTMGMVGISGLSISRPSMAEEIEIGGIDETIGYQRRTSQQRQE